MTHIAKNLSQIRSQIEKAAVTSGRQPKDITLVAVTKTHGQASVQEALRAEQRVFGENRVQEAQAKYTDLKRLYPDITLHLIGPLQTNKVKEAVRLFDVIETLDRPKLAKALAAEYAKQGKRPNLYIEVNTGAEPQKAGVLPEELASFHALCAKELALPVIGLMCIPPEQEDPAPHFSMLKTLADRLGLKHVSMGMSADFEQAIRHGATHVRIGTALFGARESFVAS